MITRSKYKILVIGSVSDNSDEISWFVQNANQGRIGTGKQLLSNWVYQNIFWIEFLPAARFFFFLFCVYEIFFGSHYPVPFVKDLQYFLAFYFYLTFFFLSYYMHIEQSRIDVRWDNTTTVHLLTTQQVVVCLSFLFF